MAKKTIVRWKPPNELYSRRELTVADLKGIGIFTQKKALAWDRSTGYWLDAEGISKEVMDRLESPEFSNDQLGHFTVETQEVDDDIVELEAEDDGTGQALPEAVEGETVERIDTRTSEGLPSQPSAATTRKGRPVRDNPQA